MPRPRIFFCITGTLFAIASNAVGKDIEGQIFIVTAGAQAIKLPLVQVKAIPAEQAEKYIREVEDKIAPARATAESDARKAIEELQSARGAVAGGFGRWMMKLQKTQSKDPTGQAWADARTEALRYNAIEKRIPKLQSRAQEAISRQSALCSAAPYFENLPDGTATTKTDADGRFKLVLPDEADFVIAASSTRQVFEKLEKYFWLVPLKRAESSVVLSNDNLTISGNPDSLLKTKE